MDEYKDRLLWAMKRASASEQQLADAIGISYQAVKKLLSGDSKGLKVANHFPAAAWLKVDAEWLATGQGQADSERVWPFQTLTPAQWAQAPIVLRTAAETMIAGAAPQLVVSSFVDESRSIPGVRDVDASVRASRTKTKNEHHKN